MNISLDALAPLHYDGHELHVESHSNLGGSKANEVPLGGVVFLVLAFLVSPFGIPAIADWLMDRLYSLKYSLQDFITG